MLCVCVLKTTVGRLHREASLRQPLPILCDISANMEEEVFCP